MRKATMPSAAGASSGSSGLPGAATASSQSAPPTLARHWENGYNESFNGKLRDELLNGEIFYTLKEAKVLIERWRQHYNTIRPHSSLGYRPPAPAAILPPAIRSTYPQTVRTLSQQLDL
jgi:putative transposase